MIDKIGRKRRCIASISAVLDILDSQNAYYDARAREYERSLGFIDGAFVDTNPDGRMLGQLQGFVRTLPSVDTTVELGCGTGIWTRELLATSRTIHALDASKNMIELNRGQLDNERVTFECADVFRLNPSRQFDRVAAGFLLSHVPDTLLANVADTIDRLTTPTGSLLIIDEGLPERRHDSGIEVRELTDGTRFKIIKVYRSSDQMQAAFSPRFKSLRMGIEAGRFFAMLLSK